MPPFAAMAASHLVEPLQTRTELERHRVSGIYSNQLDDAVGGFVEWAELRKLPVGKAWSKPELMSSILAHYCQHCKDSGQAVWRARAAVLGVQSQCRQLRGRLGRAWDAISAWQAVLPVRNRLPIPKLVVDAMAMQLVRRAACFPKIADMFWSCAILIRLGLSGMCRPNEIISLLVSDLSFSSRTGEEPLILAVARPKNRGALGRTQFRMVSDVGASAWLRWFVADMPSWARLWPYSTQQFRKIWDWALEALGLGDFGFTPACLRAGGATAAFRAGLPVSSLKFRGGWASEKSLSCYVQEAMTSLIWNSLDDTSTLRLEKSVADDQQLLLSAPPRPWHAHYPLRRFLGTTCTSSASSVSPGPSRSSSAPRRIKAPATSTW